MGGSAATRTVGSPQHRPCRQDRLPAVPERPLRVRLPGRCRRSRAPGAVHPPRCRGSLHRPRLDRQHERSRPPTRSPALRGLKNQTPKNPPTKRICCRAVGKGGGGAAIGTPRVSVASHYSPEDRSQRGLPEGVGESWTKFCPQVQFAKQGLGGHPHCFFKRFCLTASPPTRLPPGRLNLAESVTNASSTPPPPHPLCMRQQPAT